jgi:hypothetical protein
MMVPGVAIVAALIEFGSILMGGSGVASASGPCGTNGAFSSSGSTDTCTYTANAQDTFAVPSGVSSLSVVVDGVAGGDISGCSCPGGPGGEYKATLTGAALSAGTLTVFPGAGIASALSIILGNGYKATFAGNPPYLPSSTTAPLITF